MPFKNQNTTAYAAGIKPATRKTSVTKTKPAPSKAITAKTLLAIALLTAVLAYAGCSSSSTTEVDPSATASTTTAETDPQPPGRTPADVDTTQGPWVSAGNLKDVSAELPFDAATKQGQLDNGLRYYIQENANPSGTAHLSLMIKAGSANERDDQRGYAHFLEHMMFNGTKKYPKAELADFLGTLGADIGPDVGAYTGYDETGYQLNLPFNDLAKIKQAIEVLHEWARNANIEPEFVDKERGVIEAELRGVQKEGIAHLFAGNENTVLDGTPYDNRDPGGTLEAIRATTAEGLREFYETWYQPHNMAVIAVGDFDASEIETAIVEQFSEVAKVADPVQSRVAQYSYQPAGNPVSANYSPQAIDSEAHLSFARPSDHDPGSTDAVLDELVSRAVLNILQKRVAADINSGDNPARSIELTPNLPTTKIKVDTLALRAEPSQLGAAVAGTIAELERLKRFGVSADELGQIKEELQAEQDQELDNLESRQSEDVMFSLVQHFISGKAHLSGADRHRIYSIVLAQITPDMIQTWVLRQLQFSQPAIVLVGPEEARDVLPTEADITSLLEQAGGLELEQRQAAAPVAEVTQLMARPEPAEIAAERDLGEGLTELTLANGVKVLHKHSDLAPDSVSIAATSPGGEFNLSDENLIGWGFPTAILYKSGVGELSAAQYQAFKADKEYEIDPVISKTRDGFGGVSSVQDLEHALAHVHLTMTNPRVEQQGVDGLVKEINEFSSFESPALQDAYNTINRLHYGDSQRFQATPPAEVLARLSVDSVRQVIRDRFSNAADFTFIFVGDISLDALKDLTQRYLGTLPSTGERETVENLERPLPAGVHQHTVTAGPNDSGQILLRFQSPTEYSTLLTHQTRVLWEIVETRMFNLLRRELGATYAPQLLVNNHYEPAEVTEVQTFIDTAPDQAAEVAKQLVAELTGLAESMTQEEYDLAISKLESKFTLESNEILVENLKRYVEFPKLDLNELLNPEQFVEQMNYKDIKALASQVLPADHYIQVLVAS